MVQEAYMNCGYTGKIAAERTEHVHYMQSCNRALATRAEAVHVDVPMDRMLVDEVVVARAASRLHC